MVDKNYLPRLADADVARGLQALGAVVIEGIQSCGKTATARQFAASEVLLDNPASSSSPGQRRRKTTSPDPAPNGPTRTTANPRKTRKRPKT